MRYIVASAGQDHIGSYIVKDIVQVNNQRDAACFTWFINTLHVSDTVRVHLQE